MYTSNFTPSLVALPFLAALLACTFQSIYGYDTGSPERACEEMKPGHGEQSLNSNMPYEIRLDRAFIRGASRLTINVVSTKPSTHKLAGIFFVMKKPGDKRQAFGTFDPKSSSDDLKTVSCFGKTASGITHKDNKLKTAMSFQWISPNDTSAEYELHATLVRDYNSFWADIVYPQKIRVHSDAPAAAGTVQINILVYCISMVAAVVIISLLYVKLE